MAMIRERPRQRCSRLPDSHIEIVIAGYAGLRRVIEGSSPNNCR